MGEGRYSRGDWFRSCSSKELRLAAAMLFVFSWLLGLVIQGWAQSAHYREARERFDKGEFLLAMLAAQKAVEEDGGNAEYCHLYGAILLQLKQYSEAEVNLRRAVALTPGSAEFQYSLGDLLLTQKSDAAIRKEIRTGIGQPRFRNVDREGLKALERAVELDPNHWEARLRLGRVYTDLNRHDLALEQFKTIAEKNPHYPWIHSSLAVVYMVEGSVQEAIRELKTELEFYPDHHSARLELGEVLLKAGDSEKALQRLLQLKEQELSPSDQRSLHFSLAKAYRDAGRLKQALAAVKRSIELDASVPAAQYLLAQLYQQMGQSDLAHRQMAIFQKVQREDRRKKLGHMEGPAKVQD